MADPHIISTLRQKRSEISGEIADMERRLVGLREDLASVDRTLRIFDPTVVPATIKPRLKRKHPPRFRSGEMTRSLLATLRQAGEPMTVREIAVQVGRELGLDMEDRKALDPMVSNVRAALSRPRDGIVFGKRPDGVMIWSVERG